MEMFNNILDLIGIIIIAIGVVCIYDARNLTKKFFSTSDTNSATKTFKIVAKLIEKTGIDITELYPQFYNRSLTEIRFYAYLMANIQVTDNKFGYLKIDDDILGEYGVDAATAGNMINNFNNIEEIVAWAFFSHDKLNNNVRGSIRSRGPVINEIAAEFGGGGHKYASGVRTTDKEVITSLIKALSNCCKEYKEKGE